VPPVLLLLPAVSSEAEYAVTPAVPVVLQDADVRPQAAMPFALPAETVAPAHGAEDAATPGAGVELLFPVQLPILVIEAAMDAAGACVRQVGTPDTCTAGRGGRPNCVVQGRRRLEPLAILVAKHWPIVLDLGVRAPSGSSEAPPRVLAVALELQEGMFHD